MGMHLKNRFKEEDKIAVWLYHPYCADCMSNQQCSLHHIKSTESSSILNSVMLCHKHHKIADGHNKSDKELMSKYLQYTMRQVLKSGYELTKKDIDFYTHNKHLYDLQ